MTESMKFGPEWLRNLSQDGCTQPSVMSTPRCQLAEHRYGREEMLALFDQMVKAPDLLSSIPSLYVEKTQEPLALQQMTEDETRMWNRGINSDAVLRMSGKTTTGIPGILRGGRGGSIDRGRGRGRGGFHYSRGLSYEEPGDGSLRDRGDASLRDRGDGPISSSNFQRNLRTFDRSQNSLPDRGWSERNGADAGDWNGSSSPRKEVGGGRGFINDNWRRHRGGGEDEDGWRTATSSRADKWGRSNSWREGDKDGVDVERSGTGRGQNWERGRGWDEHNTSHHPHRRPWDEDIPEWANENPSESGGSFDASGAFHGGGGYSDEEEDDEGSCGNGIREPQSKLLNENSEPSRRIPVGNESSTVDREHKVSVDVVQSKDSVRDTKCEASSVVSDSTNSVTVNGVHDCASDSVRRQKSEDDMERMKEVADDLVAKLMDDEEGQDKPTTPATEKWFYRDPQGEVQGPFLSGEMAEWFRAGYFALNLLVRRSCDERYAELGDLIKLWGNIPFLETGTTFPSLKATDDISTSVTTPTQPTVTQGVSTHAGLDQGSFIMQHYRYQLLQHQYILRQQAMAGKLTQNEYWSSLSPEQQQLIMQHLQPPVDLFVPPVATAQKNHVMNLLSQLHQPKVPTTSVPDSPLSPSHSHPPALDPLQQLIQQMGGLQPSHHSLHTATSKPDTDSNPIQMLMRQLGSKTVKPQMESVWGGSVAPAAQNWLGHMPAAPPGQFPLSSLWDLQGKDIKTEQQILEEQMQAEEERRREELRKQEETQRRTEEEEKRKQLEEELRKKEEEQQRMKEKLQKMEEERKRLEEQQKQKLAEEAAERKRQQEEAKRLEEEAAARKREEAARKKEEERKRKEEEKERKRKLEEERKREEEEKQRQEEELARKKQQQEEEERRLEQQRRQTEALRRLQEQQQQRTKAAPWSQQTPGTGSSLADIQRQEKEKKERELREQQQVLQQELQAQALAAEASASANRTANSLQLKWAERKPVQLNTVKSLAEIQAEEQEQLVKQQERERQERAQQQKEVVLPPSAGIWGTASQSLNWTSSSSTVWGSSTPTTTGFWDEVTPAVVKPASKAVGGKTKSNPSLPTAGNNTSVKASGGKTRSKKEEALVMKLFEQNVSRGDEFTQWCSKALSGLQSSVDIPTFVGFLRDIESPYEVKDYVRLYLGEGKEVQEFAKQFLERRSKWRSAQKAAPLEDDMCVPAPAVNPLNMDFQEVKGKGKKAKKSKMFRVDNRILGFNVTAAQDRINVGDRDYGEM